jgi:hypothetical protein
MKSQALSSEGLFLAHKVHFTILSSLLDVRLDQEAGLFTKQKFYKAEKHEACQSKFLLSYKGINKGMPPDVVHCRALMLMIKQDFVVRHDSFKHSITRFVNLSSPSLTSLLFNDTIIGYPNEVKIWTVTKCQDVVITPGKHKL